MYFKIKTGYGDNDFVRIDNLQDLEKAQYAFLTNAKVMFSDGEVCRGQDIISIREDWHKEMGWNDTHELTDDDWNEIKQKGIQRNYIGLLAEAKDNVQTLIGMNKTNLIGKPGTIGDRIALLSSGNNQ